jgi:hypothetical protein
MMLVLSKQCKEEEQGIPPNGIREAIVISLKPMQHKINSKQEKKLF